MGDDVSSSLARRVICFDTSLQCIEEVKGPDSERPSEHREAIIATLARCKVGIEGNRDALEIGICDELLKARSDEATARFEIAGRQYEVGMGFLVVVDGDETTLLRSEGFLHSYTAACVFGPGGSNPDAARESTCRVLLREACQQSSKFAKACAMAFRDVDDDVRSDWFGTSPRRVTR